MRTGCGMTALEELLLLTLVELGGAGGEGCYCSAINHIETCCLHKKQVPAGRGPNMHIEFVVHLFLHIGRFAFSCRHNVLGSPTRVQKPRRLPAHAGEALVMDLCGKRLLCRRYYDSDAVSLIIAVLRKAALSALANALLLTAPILVCILHNLHMSQY